MKSDITKIEITWKSLFRILLMVIFAAGLYYISDILALLLVSIVISSVLDVPLNFLEKKKIPRLLGMIFIILLVISILTVLLYTVIPTIILQLRDLFNNLNKMSGFLARGIGIPRISSQLEGDLDKLASSIFSGDFSLINLVPRIFENIVLTTSVLMVSLYLAFYREGVENFLKAILPLSYEEYAIDVFHRARRTIGKWMGGQVFLSAIMGVAVFLGMEIIGVNYSLILGILTAFLEIIPFVGPIAAGAIALLVALSQSFKLAMAVVVFFIVLHQLEANFLAPMVIRRITGIHPAMAIISILIGARLAGFIGIILAIPVIVFIQELVDDFMAKKYNSQ